jgi:hypothetical protein
MKKIVRLTESDLVELVKKIIKEEEMSNDTSMDDKKGSSLLPEPFVYFLNKYGFIKTDRFQKKVSGEEITQRGPYSPPNSICYVAEICKSQKPSTKKEVYNRLHLEFDIKPKKDSCTVYVVVDAMDINKKNIGTHVIKMENVILGQEGIDRINFKMRDEKICY